MSGLGLPTAERPHEIGLSSERLDQIRKTLRNDVERRFIPGAVMLIARGGRIGFAEAFGYRDREAATPMTLDAIFRVASMTKPVTSIAAMMLAERGRCKSRRRSPNTCPNSRTAPSASIACGRGGR